MKVLYHPHDRFFRVAMEDKRVAKDFFLSCIAQPIIQKIDLDALELQKETFLDNALQGKASDILYRTPLRNSQGCLYFYLLCEHQSTIDPHMALRFLVTKVRILERHQKQYPDQPFPLIYPLLVYSGEAQWSASRDFFDSFGEEAALAKELWFAPYAMVDICRIPDETLRKQALSGMMEFALKYRIMRHEEAFYDQLFSWIAELEQEYGGLPLSREALLYLLRDMENIEANEYTVFREKAEYYLSSSLKGEVMTLAQQFEQAGREQGIQQGIQQGMQQGMQQGIQQGMQKGMQQGERNVLLRQLSFKFKQVPEYYQQKLLVASSDQLLMWGDRVLTADSIEDVFA